LYHMGRTEKISQRLQVSKWLNSIFAGKQAKV